ncbi:transposase [Terasakiella pusilla]|uniref:transposase n=1 Tax=Terasakiella pusilla TaxID=64973 RepID=UPI003AA880B3
MSLKKSDEFKREAVQLALTSGLSRKQVAADLGIGMSTLNKWIAQHKHDDLMSDPHDDLHKELARLRTENRILKEERAREADGTANSKKKATEFFASQKR